MREKKKPKQSIQSLLESGKTCAVIPKTGSHTHRCRTSLQVWPEDGGGPIPLLAISIERHAVTVLAPRPCKSGGRRAIVVPGRDLDLYEGAAQPEPITSKELAEIAATRNASADFIIRHSEKGAALKKVMSMPPPASSPAGAALVAA